MTEVQKQVQKQQENTELEILATAAALEFTSRNETFYPSPRNSKALQSYVNEHGLDRRFPGSWQVAFDSLSLQGCSKIDPCMFRPLPSTNLNRYLGHNMP